MKKEDIIIKEIIESETGNRFNKNKMICPFHQEKTASFSIKNNRFKCFGCDESGDVISFIRKYKNLSFIDTCKYLDIEIDSNRETYENEKDLIKSDCFRVYGKEAKEIYQFTNKEGEGIYYLIKFFENGKKQQRYCKIVKNKVVWNLEKIEKVPYNLHILIKSLKNKKNIFIVEGEKDCETLKSEGYVATSFKGLSHVNNFNFSIFLESKVYVIGDTGKAGEEYVEYVKEKLFDIVDSFNIVDLPEIEELGDNKDISDWLEVGHTRDEFNNCLYKTLDLKNKYELQQDQFGIYKTVLKEKKIDREIKTIESKVYITNFSIKNTKNIRYVDDEAEGIELDMITLDNEIIKRVGNVDVFNDVKIFKNFLGTMKLTFKGKSEDLNLLKEWINKYFIKQFEEVHAGIKFKDDSLITADGAIFSKGINKKIRSNCQQKLNFNINNQITKEDNINLLIKHIFNLNTKGNIAAILGTIINNMCYAHAKHNGIKLHHLLIIGESGSGKSTIKRKLVNPILGYSSGYEGDAMDKITQFALQKTLSQGNYTKIFDEFKPSSMTSYAKDNILSIMRNLYDETSIVKGNKDMSVNYYKLTCPMVIFGEEGIPEDEKASTERSLIVYFAKSERPKNSSLSLKFIDKNEELLNRLGSAVLKYILNMDSKEYLKIRGLYEEANDGNLKDRPLNTWINTCTGIHILNDVLESIGASKIELDYLTCIYNIIKENILNGGEECYTIYENMLLKINDMVDADERYFKEDKPYYVHLKGGETHIKTIILDELSKYIKTHGLSDKLLKRKDFLNQCTKAGYIIQISKNVKVNGGVYKYCLMDVDKLYKLGCYSLIGAGIVEQKNKSLKIVK